MAPPSGPIDGVKVLDLTRILAGPYATMLLGDLGAEVIKVEPPNGDDSRAWGPPFVGGESAYYLGVNRNKRGIRLDLALEDDRMALRDLASDVDVLIENFKTGTMERWGLGYEATLREANPRLVYCSITGYGRSGPWAHLAGYDPVVEAVSGLMSVTGQADGEPTKFGVALVDILTGHQAALGVVAALHRRGVDGLGQRVDVSLFETALSVLANQASTYLVSGRVPSRHGNAHPAIVPFEVFAARDGDVMVCAGNDRLFTKLCSLLGIAEVADDARFATNPGRVEHRDALTPILARAFAAYDREELVGRAERQGVPLGPVQTIERALAQPQVAARDMLVELSHPTVGTLRQVGLPIKLDRTPATIRRPPPLLGQHDEEILGGIRRAREPALGGAGLGREEDPHAA
jgi:crotonobetainyl-CoA:carnitine CoA-transferase CaiB-like acyl-CoA transferase